MLRSQRAVCAIQVRKCVMRPGVRQYGLFWLCSGILAKMLTTNRVSELVSEELKRITDSALLAGIRELLVSRYPVERGWDYGRPGEKFPCWTILEHPPSNTGIAYYEQGFGPTHSWGVVALSLPRRQPRAYSHQRCDQGAKHNSGRPKIQGRHHYPSELNSKEGPTQGSNRMGSGMCSRRS